MRIEIVIYFVHFYLPKAQSILYPIMVNETETPRLNKI